MHFVSGTLILQISAWFVRKALLFASYFFRFLIKFTVNKFATNMFFIHSLPDSSTILYMLKYLNKKNSDSTVMPYSLQQNIQHSEKVPLCFHYIYGKFGSLCLSDLDS